MKIRQTAVLAALALATVLSASAGATNYEVVVENLIPGGLDTGQPFSPPVTVVHNAGYSQWADGAMASPGLELVAREGDPTLRAAEAMGDANVYSVVVGTGPFFGSQSIMIEGNPGDLFSVAWMLGRTNDLFAGLHDVVLPASGSMSMDTMVWDSGTEVNTGMIEDLGFYGFPNTGPDEDNPIAAISSYSVVNDPDYGQLTWNFPPSARVTITVMDPTAADENSISQIKSIYR
jgi:hypothetical protein